jgi:hypothetical protein
MKRDTLVIDILKAELKYINKTIEEVKEEEEWYNKYTITEEQYEEWKTYSTALIQKVLKCNKATAEKEFSWFNLMYGIKVKQK